MTERPACGDESQCSHHASYPPAILSKIEWTGDMAGSVKAHAKHLLVAAGSDAMRWPEEVTSVKGSYVSALDDAIGGARLDIKVRMSLSDGPSHDEHGRPHVEPEDIADPEQSFDLLLFPDQLRIHAVRKSQLPHFVRVLGEYAAKQRAVRGGAAAAAAPAAAADSSSSSSTPSAVSSFICPSVVFPLPATRFEGTSFLICSHKLRDRRCGITGPILEDEIHRAISISYPSTTTPHPVHTFKISHIGGHKYAGNVIAYPPGVWYGRVLPCHVPHLLLAHCPEFAYVDTSGDERLVVRAGDLADKQMQLLKPLIRGQVDKH